MKYFLEGLLPRILPPPFQLNLNVYIRAFEGKQHLRKELPKRLRAFNKFQCEVKIIVIHDQDSADCFTLKHELLEIINSQTNLPSLVRIACSELESFYFGELEILESIYPRFKSSRHTGKRKYRDPDKIQSPGRELKKLIPEFDKTKTARKIGPIISLSTSLKKPYPVSTSISFFHLHHGIRTFLSPPNSIFP